MALKCCQATLNNMEEYRVLNNKLTNDECIIDDATLQLFIGKNIDLKIILNSPPLRTTDKREYRASCGRVLMQKILGSEDYVANRFNYT